MPRVPWSCAFASLGSGPMPVAATAMAAATATPRITGARRRGLVGLAGSFIVCLRPRRMGANLVEAPAEGQRGRRSRWPVLDQITECACPDEAIRQIGQYRGGGRVL